MLTLETGEGISNADSLVSLAEVRAFASSRGKSVSDDDAILEGQVRVAHDYLLSIEDRFQGTRRVSTQALPFPRTGMIALGFWVPEATIPQGVKNAISQLVIEDIDILPTQEGRVVTKETVGPISTEYSVSGAGTANPALPRVTAFLQPYTRNAFVYRTERA